MATGAQPRLPAMRIKSQWFKSDGPKSAEQQASAMAFIVWRTSLNMLKRMRGADFDVDAGAPYFAFMREVLVFLIAVVDRIAYVRMDGDERSAFTTALVRHCADTLADNENDLLGPRADGQSSQDSFVDLVNEVVDHYAEFGADALVVEPDASFTPSFGFMRYLGNRLAPTLPAKDQRWVLDQVMATEAPEAVDIVRGAMLDLLSAEPRKARRARLSGD
jgi:hypothetical protein